MSYSKEIQEMITVMRNNGLSSRRIANALGVSKSGVNEYYAKVIQKNTKEDNSRILFLSDLHFPYHHPDTFEFLQYLKDKYNPTRVISVGDECFDGEASVFTRSGWIPFNELADGSEVLQYNEDGSASFVVPSRVVRKTYTGLMVTRKNQNYYSHTTENHDIVLKKLNGELVKFPANHEKYTHYKIPRNCFIDGAGIPLTDDELKLFVAVSADFTIMQNSAARGSLTKKRKIERMRALLKQVGAKYTETVQPSNPDSIHFYIATSQFPFLSKIYPTEWLTLATIKQRKLILEEMSYWDGHRDPKRNRHIFCSSLTENIIFMQTLAHTVGLEASVRDVESKFGQSMQVSILYGKKWTTNNCSIKKEYVENLLVYCCTVPSGMIVVRQNNSITISGNCDKHSLSFHSSDPDLHSAGDELKQARKYIKELEKMFPVMQIIESNHGSLVWRKAKEHGIPRQYIKSYNDVLGVGDGWSWHNDLTIDLPNGLKCYVHHGKTNDVIKLSQQMGMCAVQGHYHEKFKVDYWANPNGLYWGMQIGCLIDDSSYAFAYNNVNIKRPIIGTGLIINSLPVLEPMLLGKGGRWIGND